jgi:hypothetical protein
MESSTSTQQGESTDTPTPDPTMPTLGRVVLIVPIGGLAADEVPAIVNGVDSVVGQGVTLCARGFPKSGEPIQFTGLRRGADPDIPEPNTWRWPPRV